MCIEDGRLKEEDQQKFREFCEILSAYYHFEFHEKLETLKDNFTPFNPDSATKPLHSPSAEQIKKMEEDLVGTLCGVLEKANYTKLSQDELEKALDEEFLITLRMDVNFDDFDQMVFYHRGDTQEIVPVKRGLFKTEDFTLDIYERVVLLLKFKDEEYFKSKKVNLKKLNFTPGKTYVYLYKNIPKADIEVLFPNVEISMNWKDRLMLIVPAVIAAVPVILKVLPQLVLIAGVIAIALKAEAIAKMFGVDMTQQQALMPMIIASLSALAILGGFGFKQYIKYKNKRIAFLKDVSDTLFFKNLDSNAGVFNMLIDEAEEEENKEVILAYYHLLTSETSLTQDELDDKIESWMEEKFNTKIDFNVEKALHKMMSLKGVVVRDGQEVEVPLLAKDKDDKCCILQIDESKTVIDYVWDNIFDYNS